MLRACSLFTLTMLFPIMGLHAQEIQIFRVGDFDLKGAVKRCLVTTPYGKETFEFTPEGLLTKTITQYNEQDQDISYYRFDQGELVEKRMESYKNDLLDEATSMANFYTIDSLPQRTVVEDIISYDKQFLEKQVYRYDPQGRLVRIITSNIDGVDETVFEYEQNRDGRTVSTLTNGILERTVRTRGNPGEPGSRSSRLTKEYMDGQPNTALEEMFDEQGRPISREDFIYHVDDKEFVSQEKRYYHYKDGVLDRVVTKTLTTEAVEHYIFQFDNHGPANWVRQIITPDNSYISRVITYYPEKGEEQIGH